MVFLVTLLLVMPLMLLLFWLLLRFGQRNLRQRPERLLELTRLARSGQLEESAWDFGLAHPLHHDPEAEALRRALLQVAQQYHVSHRRIHHHKRDFLFTDEGLQALARIEQQLEQLVEERNTT
ncbi:hypothetical protein [Marinospirillum alkaliphilum]|uniref:Uncharacterized protein n=1 Tax=Marinospirillum alkaliphilum DSM 21637 TaxID=1122209 RepID=A0A1K1Z8C5_9GAMM|nr:hypothetical protein [Marinospirillum alkaliphilum]SFX70441.1 hypothetical protein SAMN02745752_02595 [Marinospirillum alkaliphilum DSM 21637]